MKKTPEIQTYIRLYIFIWIQSKGMLDSLTGSKLKTQHYGIDFFVFDGEKGVYSTVLKA